MIDSLPNEIILIILVYLFNQSSFEMYYQDNDKIMRFIRGKKFLPIKSWIFCRSLNHKIKNIVDDKIILKQFDLISFAFAKMEPEKIISYVRLGLIPPFGARRREYTLASKLEEFQLNQNSDYSLNSIFSIKINHLDPNISKIKEKIYMKRKASELWKFKWQKSMLDEHDLTIELNFLEKYKFSK